MGLPVKVGVRGTELFSKKLSGKRGEEGAFIWDLRVHHLSDLNFLYYHVYLQGKHMLFHVNFQQSFQQILNFKMHFLQNIFIWCNRVLFYFFYLFCPWWLFLFLFFLSVMTLKRKWFSKVRSRSVIASVIVNDIYIFRRLCPWLSLLFISRCICHDYPSSSTKWLFLYVHIHENNLSRLSFTCSISYFSQMLNRSIFWSKWNTPKNRKKEGEVTKTLQWSQFLLIPPY